MKRIGSKTKQYSIKSLGIVMIMSFFISCGMNKEESRQLYDKALHEFYAGKYQEAITIFDQLIKEDPKRSELYFYRGSAWFNLRDADKALADFNQAILINPTYADAISTRGDIYSYLGKKDEACKDYKEAYRLGKPNMRDKIKYCP